MHTAAHLMPPFIFISYSRQETQFVDDLYQQLSARGEAVWLDYMRLHPGLLWQNAIDQAILECDALIIVISASSVSSHNVRREWQMAIAHKKRIILAIFDAVTPPAPLAGLEWVDFRGNFEKAALQLHQRIQSPPAPALPYPRTGFAVPTPVWLIFTASLIPALLSLATLYTGLMPFYLLRLPYQILKREYNYFRVGVSVILLPVVLLLTRAFFPADNNHILTSAFVISLFASPAFFWMLQTRALRRWVQPIAARPRPIPTVHIAEPCPKQVLFGIEYAPQDAHYAKDFIRALENEGHHFAKPDQPIDIGFVFISNFQRNTHYDMDRQVIYPIILQNVQDLPRSLQRIQWIDYRRGMRNLSALARLLHDPSRLINALGSIPMGQQSVMPYIIQLFTTALVISAIFSIAGWIPTFIQIGHAIIRHPDFSALMGFSIFVFGFIILLEALFAYALLQRLRQVAAPLPFILGLFILTALNTLSLAAISWMLNIAGNTAGVIGPAFGAVSYFISLGILLVMIPFRWRDLWRWMPARA